jgi:fatty-acyl-CoA synthase
MGKKLSYVSGVSDKPLLGLTIGEMFDKTVESYKENDALISVHQNIRWTYSQLKTEVDKCALALYAGGLRKGDRIGIWAMNRAEWMVVQYATAKLGAILVNINPSYRVHELKYALNQSECKFLIYDEKTKYADYLAMLNELMPNLKYAIKGEINSIVIPNLTTIISLGNDNEKAIHTWDDYMKKADNVSPDVLEEISKELTFDQAINIQYTSGTTGFPKGATLSHHNILNNGYFVTESLHLTHKDKMIIPVPLYHCFGMVMGNLGCLTHGSTVIYTSRAFEPEEIIKTIENENASILYGVPTMFHTILNNKSINDYNVKSLRGGIMAGAICPVELMKQVQDIFEMEDMQIAYGMTETSPVSTQTTSNAPFEKRVSTVGTVHPHQEVKLIDPTTGLVVPIGEKGELCTRGYSVMLGYWKDEKRTRESIDSARWMHTGDLATMDEEGYINIVGRIKDMIIRGGENVYPKEIEAFIRTHPKVDNVSVIGVPDEVYGEAIMAWVKPYDAVEMSEDDLRKFCEGKIAHFKIPKYFKFVEECPKTVTGKIRKVEMREKSIVELGLTNVMNK